MAAESGDLWVFGYGSLMWRPGFTYRERHFATLTGYHRSLCIFSHVHRGTPEMPGLVLGLDRGGKCRGVAFAVEAAEAQATLAYLREREQVTAVYLERRVRIRLDDGRIVPAVTYVADRRHPQYAGRLPVEDLLRLVNQGVGVSGANPDYVRATHRQLMEMGVSDPILAGIAARLSQGEPTARSAATARRSASLSARR
ncbi:gamma-glutamylcyclotransferase [Enterovirga aerilata]|uniref:glutathione-specific gamma-glutamylcyclotransferase n=1 Tax=Enterovirga aerilata TaxID=2730920 RepID=A0A849I1B4_9HYPH|nr:gamma-glutamylcyclotransferase [Enterovirga sp. DB1703]NNM71364.1 gamma-glutamylcyclotransferase [Enterovirga sp. DB1703]